MARTDKTIIKEISAEAKKKGVEIPTTEGVTNEGLEAILNQLKEATPPPPPAKKDGDGNEVFPYSVAMGKSITTKRGILADGEEITVKDLSGGIDDIKALVKSGHIKKG